MASQEALMQLRIADTLSHQGRAAEATAFRRGALTSNPSDTDMLSHLLFHLHFVPGMTPAALYDEHKAYGAMFPVTEYEHSNSPLPDRPLNIGYVSGDFHQHPVGMLIMPVLNAHDRQEFNVTCYYNSSEIDKVTEYCQERAQFRNIVGRSIEVVDTMIREDEIDILVDLSGHTNKNLLPVFAKKPAPIQCTWAGYFGTTGLKQIDYLISDNTLSPYGCERYVNEQIVRLPDGYACFAMPSHAPEITPLPALTNGYVTFGCFNKLVKINPQVIALWGKLMREIPNSKLLLKNDKLMNDVLKERIPMLFAVEGIDESRLIIDGEYAPHPEYLATVASVDIALDPFPFSGGATTVDMLYMGVPVVTLPGESWASRHSASYLNVVGLGHNFIAKDEDDYLRIVRSWATDLDDLATLRESLRQRVKCSPLCQSYRFTKNLETAYRNMWRTWCHT